MIYTKFEDYLIEEFLIESNMITEKLNFDTVKNFVRKVTNKPETVKKLIKKFNSITNSNSRRMIVAAIVLLMIGTTTSKLKNNGLDAVSTALINSAEETGELKLDDFEKLPFKFDWDMSYIDSVQTPKIISMGSPGLIDDVNSVKPGRLDTTKIAQYDQYDDEIVNALEELKAKGENPDMDLIKIIMVIETGMKPRKNSLGYEGFPQTKWQIVNGWAKNDTTFYPGINQKHGTNFTMKDMYDPGKAAQYIHYYLKSLTKSDNVENSDDMLIAYNWGVGNLGKYKDGKKDLPKQSRDYVSMYRAMKPYMT